MTTDAHTAGLAAERAGHLLGIGRPAEAREILVRALAEVPDSARLHGLHAQALLGLRDAAGALAAGNEVVALQPDTEWGHRLCAIALLRMRHAGEAVRAAEVAVRLAPHLATTYLTLAEALLGVPGRQQDAWSMARRAVELEPGSSTTLVTLGLAAKACGDERSARNAWERAIAIDPANAVAINNLASLRHGRAIVASARAYGHALSLDPSLTVPRANIESLALSVVRRLYFFSLVALVVGLIVTVRPAEDSTASSVTPFTVVLGIGVALTVVVCAWQLARQVPAGVRRYVVSRLWRTRVLAVSLALSLVTLGFALAVLLVPGAAGAAGGAFPFIGIANLTLILTRRFTR